MLQISDDWARVLTRHLKVTKLQKNKLLVKLYFIAKNRANRA
jgi:hypothetical protein